MGRRNGSAAVKKARDPFKVAARVPCTCGACHGRDPSCDVCDGVGEWEILLGKDSLPTRRPGDESRLPPSDHERWEKSRVWEALRPTI